MEPIEINAGTFYLRALRADDRLDDRPSIVRAFSDPEFLRWSPEVQSMTLDEAGAYVTRRADAWAADECCSWAVADPLSGDLLGEVGVRELDFDDGTGRAFCWTMPESRGRRVASTGLNAALRFAFDGLGLSEVDYQFAEANTGSQRVAEACDFAPSGVPGRTVTVRGEEHALLRWIRRAT